MYALRGRKMIDPETRFKICDSILLYSSSSGLLTEKLQIAQGFPSKPPLKFLISETKGLSEMVGVLSHRTSIVSSNKRCKSSSTKSIFIPPEVCEMIIPRLPSSLLLHPSLFSINTWKLKFQQPFIKDTLTHQFSIILPNSNNTQPHLCVKKNILDGGSFVPLLNLDSVQFVLGTLWVMGFCHGFLLIGDNTTARSVICNPLNGDLTCLPQSANKGQTGSFLHGLGYGDDARRFALIRVRRRRLHHGLGLLFVETHVVGNSYWNEEDTLSGYNISVGTCSYFGGFFHWFRTRDDRCVDAIECTGPGKGQVKHYALPLVFEDKKSKNCTIVVLGGVLSVACNASSGLEIYQMRTYAVADWTHWATICLPTVAPNVGPDVVSYPLIGTEHGMLLHVPPAGFIFYHRRDNSFTDMAIGKPPHFKFHRVYLAMVNPLRLEDMM